MTTDSRVRALCLGAALAPVAAGILAGFVGRGPARASAVVLEPMPQLPILPTVPTEEARVEIRSVASPFRFDGAESIVPVLTTPESAPPRPATPDPVFTLSAVMPHPARPLAVINGKPRRIGDTVEPGWTLTSIDGDARRVTLTHRTGRTLLVGMAAQAP